MTTPTRSTSERRTPMIQYPGYPAFNVSPTSLWCLASGCKDPSEPGPRPSERGTDLCAIHHRQFPAVLESVRTHLAPVRSAIVRTRKPSDAGRSAPRGSNRPDGGAQWSPHASSAFAEASDWIGFLGRTILRDRPTPAPVVREYSRTEVEYVDGIRTARPVIGMYTVPGSHGFTGREEPDALLAIIARHHARWLSGYPGLGAALFDDARTLVKTMVRAIDGNTVRVVQARFGGQPIRCQYVVNSTDFGDEVCGSDVLGILHPDDPEKVSRMRCAMDPEHLDLAPEQWLGYAAAHA